MLASRKSRWRTRALVPIEVWKKVRSPYTNFEVPVQARVKADASTRHGTRALSAPDQLIRVRIGAQMFVRETPAL